MEKKLCSLILILLLFHFVIPILSINSLPADDLDFDRIIVEDSIAYAEIEGENFCLMNCTQAETPVIINEIYFGDGYFSMDYFVRDSIIFCCIQYPAFASLRIYNASNPHNLILIGSVNLNCEFFVLENQIVVENDTIYILGLSLFCIHEYLEFIDNSALFVINCSNLSNPRLESTYYFNGAPYINFFVKNELVYFLKNYKTNEFGIEIVELVDNETILSIGEFIDTSFNSSLLFDNFDLYNGVVLLAKDDGIIPINVSDITQPEVLDSIWSDLIINDFCISNDYLFVIGQHIVQIFDLSDLNNVSLLTEWFFNSDKKGWFIDGYISEDSLYLLRETQIAPLHFFIVDISDIYNLQMKYPDSDWKSNLLYSKTIQYVVWGLVFVLPLVVVITIVIIRKRKSRNIVPK